MSKHKYAKPTAFLKLTIIVGSCKSCIFYRYRQKTEHIYETTQFTCACSDKKILERPCDVEGVTKPCSCWATTMSALSLEYCHEHNTWAKEGNCQHCLKERQLEQEYLVVK